MGSKGRPMDLRAQVGIGTMIVFIASIIVAAAGATLLLDASGNLQERSSQTGSAVTQEVASNLVIRSVYGVRPASNGDLESLRFTASLAAGSPPVDLSEVVIDHSDGESRTRLTQSTDHGGDVFVAEIVRDPQRLFSPDDPVIGGGSMVEVQIDLTQIGSGQTLGPREEVEIAIVPEVGAPLSVRFTTPIFFGNGLVVSLR